MLSHRIGNSHLYGICSEGLGQKRVVLLVALWLLKFYEFLWSLHRSHFLSHPFSTSTPTCNPLLCQGKAVKKNTATLDIQGNIPLVFHFSTVKREMDEWRRKPFSIFLLYYKAIGDTTSQQQQQQWRQLGSPCFLVACSLIRGENV